MVHGSCRESVFSKCSAVTVLITELCTRLCIFFRICKSEISCRMNESACRGHLLEPTPGSDGGLRGEGVGCLLIVMASPAASEPAGPTAAAVLVHRDARSEPMPRDAILVPDVAMPANMPFACLGAAYAVHVLLEHLAEPGRVPDVFDERRHPLCGPNAPLGIVSFVWTDLPVPRLCIVHDFVLLVASRLQLTLKELVFAYAIVEGLINDQPVYAQAHCLRPIFLSACVVATKAVNDTRYTP